MPQRPSRQRVSSNAYPVSYFWFVGNPECMVRRLVASEK